MAIALPDVASLSAQVVAINAERDALQAELDNAMPPSLSSVLGLSKSVLLDRLIAADLFNAALASLKSDPRQYERWQALTVVDPDNEEIKALLTDIGGDL